MNFSGNPPDQVGFWFFRGVDLPDHTMGKVSAHVDHLGEYTYHIQVFGAETSMLLSTFIDANGVNAFAGPIPIPGG